MWAEKSIKKQNLCLEIKCVLLLCSTTKSNKVPPKTFIELKNIFFFSNKRNLRYALFNKIKVNNSKTYRRNLPISQIHLILYPF